MRPISIGSLKDQKPCEFCNALLWPSETSQACCLKGKLYNKHSGRGLKFMPDPPVDIQHMLSKPSLAASLHNYNNCLAMASVGGNFPEQSVNYRIQGKLYHQIGSLGAPPPGERPKFCALYFNDADHEVQNRLGYQSRAKLVPAIVTNLQELLRTTNPYLASFKAALELYSDRDDIKIVLYSTSKKKAEQAQSHPGCFSLPQGSEVENCS